MANYYSVVQFVPDAVRDERINVAVLVFGESTTRIHSLPSWKRVKGFWSRNISGLAESVDDLRHLTKEEAEAASNCWTNGLRITKPAASLLGIEELESDAARRFLVDNSGAPAVTAQHRSRDAAKRVTRTAIRLAMKHRFGKQSKDLVKDDLTVVGKRDRHTFDVGIGNGKLLLAAAGLSFDLAETKSRRVETDLHALAFSIEDVRSQNRDVRLAVVVIDGRGEDLKKRSKEAKGLLSGLGADVVTEERAEEWAGQFVDGIELDHAD